MKNNPQINRFLDAGIRYYAKGGIQGLKLEEICDEVGVAKSSFYHYFGSKEGFIQKLYDYWYDLSTASVYERIKHIENGPERFSALKEIIDGNRELEYFYLQLRIYAINNQDARNMFEKAKKKRFEVLYEIFLTSGQDHDEAMLNSRKMLLMFFGRLALTQGYTGSTSEIDLDPDEWQKILGLV